MANNQLNKPITHHRLKELLELNYMTGVFTRRISIGRRSKAGTVAKALDKGDGYMRIAVNGSFYNYAHIVWFYVYGYWPSEIDHKNGNRSDNRPANLRECARAQNMQARKEYRKNKHGYRGVNQLPSGRYQAQISVNGRKRGIGTFDTPEAAHAAWRRTAHQLRGEFACLD